MSDTDLDQLNATSVADAAALADEAQATLPALDLPTLKEPPPDDPATKPSKASKPREISGLVLVDVPSLELKCGQYITLPAATAKGLEAAGEFDPKAPRPE